MPRLSGSLLIFGALLLAGRVNSGEPDKKEARTPNPRSRTPIEAGPEFAVAPASKENQRLPDVAFGGGVFLAVWQDGWNGVGGDSNILATRIQKSDPDSTFKPELILDAEKPIEVCRAKDLQEAPRVAFANGVFLVVWHDFRNGKDADIHASRITPEGRLLDPQGIAIASRPHNQIYPTVTHNGTDFLILWSEVRYGQTYDLMCTRLESKTGKILDPKGVLLAKNVSAPAAGFTGKRYVISWVNAGRGRKLHYCRYDPKTLARFESEPARVGHADAFGRLGELKMASGSGEVVTVWGRGTSPDPWGWGGPGAILSVRITDAGQVPETRTFNRIRWSPAGRAQYVDRILPGVLDCARWAGHKGWPQGRPGGFKAAEDGYWPHAYLAVEALPDSPGTYFAVWVRANLRGLGQTGKLDILGGRLKSSDFFEAPDFPPTVIAPHNQGSSTLPNISASDKSGPFLLVYERRGEEDRPTVAGRFVQVRPIE